MPPIATARRHFQEDITRAKGLLNHAQSITDGKLAADVLRASWMMSVGACDAFFCDVYGDLIARVLRARDIEPAVALPNRLQNLKIPVVAVIRQSQGGWRWRMAARELIEEESVLSLEKIRSLFNQFCQDCNKLINKDSIEKWLIHKDSSERLFGIKSDEYQQLSDSRKADAKQEAIKILEERFKYIFQRRHDCIHNCDRPKVSPQKITAQMVEAAIIDIEFLVQRCSEMLRDEFIKYLSRIGFSGITINRVCM